MRHSEPDIFQMMLYPPAQARRRPPPGSREPGKPQPWRTTLPASLQQSAPDTNNPMEEPGIGTNGTFSPEISSEVARPPSSHPCSFQSSQEVQDVRLSSLFASLFHKFCISPPLTQSHTYSPRKLSLCPWKLNYILAKLPISSTCSQNFLHLLALTDTCHPAGVLYCEVYSYLASGSYWFFHTPEPGSGVG